MQAQLDNLLDLSEDELEEQVDVTGGPPPSPLQHSTAAGIATQRGTAEANGGDGGAVGARDSLERPAAAAAAAVAPAAAGARGVHSRKPGGGGRKRASATQQQSQQVLLSELRLHRTVLCRVLPRQCLHDVWSGRLHSVSAH